MVVNWQHSVDSFLADRGLWTVSGWLLLRRFALREFKYSYFCLMASPNFGSAHISGTYVNCSEVCSCSVSCIYGTRSECWHSPEYIYSNRYWRTSLLLIRIVPAISYISYLSLRCTVFGRWSVYCGLGIVCFESMVAMSIWRLDILCWLPILTLLPIALYLFLTRFARP